MNGNDSSFAPLAHKGPSSSSEVEDYQVRKKSWEKNLAKNIFLSRRKNLGSGANPREEIKF